MKELFIPYEQALELKKLGFKEECLAYHNIDPKLKRNGFVLSKSISHKFCLKLPLYQQAFRWFRENYNLNSFIIDSKSYNWYFNINDMIKDDVVSEVLYFKTYEEVELECLKKLIEIVKNK